MNPYVAWLKSNIPIVVLVVVMIAAAVVLPILSSGMNEALRKEVASRAAFDAKLNSIQTASHSIDQPGQEPITAKGPINPKAIEVAGEFEKRLSEDAAEVRSFILTRNQQDRKQLIDGFFPNPPNGWQNSMQFDFYEALQGKYRSLIEEVGAGTPPPIAEIEAEIRRADELFRTQKLAKSATDSLTSEEAAQLRKELQQARLVKYTERAQGLSMYCWYNTIDTPYWDGVSELSLRGLFDWQWQLWIKQDILRALHDANKNYESLLQAPVKRVRYLAISPLPAPANNNGGSAAPPPSTFGAPAASPEEAAPEAPAAVMVDPKVEAARDYSVSYTGRVSNQLYDVRRVSLGIVVDTARIPEVLDALARQNLMTVIDLKMRPTDAHADLENGFIYGVDITTDLDLTIETIWLREWTAQLMPAEIKQVLQPPVM